MRTHARVAQVSDSVVQRIGAPARRMGDAFGVEAWACELFAEEVVRGGPAFAVSLVLSSIEPVLRSAADLGAWQVRARARARGGGGGALEGHACRRMHALGHARCMRVRMNA